MGQQAAGGFNHDVKSSRLGDMRVHVKFTATTAGAVVTPLTYAPYIKSIVKGTTGFVITFKSSWANFLSFTGNIVPVAYSAARACNIQLATDAISDKTTPALTFLVVDGLGGTAIDLTTGDTVYMTLNLSYKKIGN